MNVPLEDVLVSLSDADRAFLAWQTRWLSTARPQQIPPEDGWTEFGAMAGRGFGKTRVGAEWLGRVAYEDPEALPRCVVAPTQADVRFTCFEGESGLLNVIPPECVEKYNASDLILTLSNGATIRGFSAEKADRLRGPQHADAWCFVAGTMVATPHGSRPIERLQPGDLVLTRRGVRMVLANSERVADVGEVAFSNGVKLVGTADHPLYLPRGWTRLDRLQVGDQACAIAAWNGVANVGTGIRAATTSARTRALSQSARSVCTAWFGRLSMASCQKATTFITAMRTRATTLWTTWNVSLTALTERITPANSPFPARIGTQVQPLSVFAANAAASSCASVKSLSSANVASRSAPMLNALPTRRARAAVGHSALVPETFAVSVASTWRPTGRQSVYCLKVAGEPEYFANGVLVHNCDELAAWGKDAVDTWDMLQFGLRLGPHPRVMWTTTPKPVEIVRKLTVPQEGRIIVHGSTYDNAANLPKSFFKALEQYAGTKIGRQELDGELLDPEEAGIIKRSQFRLWPAKTPLPKFDWIIMSLDTAYTEKTVDKKGDADPTASTVWGVFNHEKRSNIMLLDCWDDHLGLPELIRKVRREMNTAYGDDEDAALIKPMFGSAKPLTSGRKPDILLIEDKGSGISLRQMLMEHGLEAYAYNPGRADKLSRLHVVSPVFAQKRIWLPESEKKPGTFRTWCEPLVAQLCTFTGEGSIKHDDYVDATTQALRLCLDKGFISMLPPPPPAARLSSKQRANPYAA